MKHSSSKSSRHVELCMSPSEAQILSSALDFVMCSDSHTPVGNSFCHSSSFSAAEKIDAKEFFFSKQELRSITGAIDYSLQHIFDESDCNTLVEDDFPGIISEIQESISILKSIRVRVSAVSAKLSHRK